MAYQAQNDLLMNTDLKLVVAFICDGIKINYYQQRSKDTIYLEKEYLCAVDNDGKELWSYIPPNDEFDQPIWMGGAEATLDNKFVHVGQSNNRQLKIDPHTGRIFSNIYQHT
ncbi:MAG: hypothetical protein ABL923_01990 [Burkholderiaceae bacterium]